MKALTLTQPWATLVALGKKRIETRSWSTRYRGLLAIHAARRFPPQARRLVTTEPFETALFEGLGSEVEAGQLVLGAVLAVCRLVDCCQISPDSLPPEPERSFGDYRSGRWAWTLDSAQALPYPVPAMGRLGLWNWDPPPGLQAFLAPDSPE